jgi:hypothetical protein
LYASLNIIRVFKSKGMRLVENVACIEQARSAYIILVPEPEGKAPLGRPRRKRENNIKMDLMGKELL